MIIGDADAPLPALTRSRVDVTADDDLPQVLVDTVAGLLGKPRARGWIHLSAAAVFSVAGAALVPVAWIATSPKAGWATLIYSTTIVAMFSCSAIYHRVQWRSQNTLRWMKRVDHSLIFVFIAGSYTPIALLAMPTSTGTLVLGVVYTGAATGVALKMLWPSAPRAIGLPLYLLVGYVATWFAGTLLDDAGASSSRYSSPEACSITSAQSSTPLAGPTHGHRRLAIMSFFTHSARPQRSATTSLFGSSSHSWAIRVHPQPAKIALAPLILPSFYLGRRRLNLRIHGRPRLDRKKRFLLSAVAPSTNTRHPRRSKAHQLAQRGGLASKEMSSDAEATFHRGIMHAQVVGAVLVGFAESPCSVGPRTFLVA